MMSENLAKLEDELGISVQRESHCYGDLAVILATLILLILC